MNIDNKLLKELKAQGQGLAVSVTVGKNGITDATIEELDRHLRKEKLVKVRLLKSATHEAGLQNQVDALASRTSARVIDVRGGTAVFHRS